MMFVIYVRSVLRDIIDGMETICWRFGFLRGAGCGVLAPG
jgi:hypothetical protein